MDPVADETPRSRVRAQLLDLQADHPELSNSALARLAAASFPRHERALIQEYLAGEFQTMLALELARQTVAMRQGIFTVLDPQNRRPDALPLAQRSERVRQTLYERIPEWRELVPSERRAIPLLDMSRRQLLESADYDKGMAFHHGYKALIKERLAAGMPDDDSPAARYYTAEQVVDLTLRVKKEMSRGTFRLAVKTVQPLPSGDRVSRETDGRHAKKPGDR